MSKNNSEQKENNTIRNLPGEYKKIEPDCREGVRAQLERMKELCKERNSLYKKQNNLKGKKWEIEKSLERYSVRTWYVQNKKLELRAEQIYL